MELRYSLIVILLFIFFSLPSVIKDIRLRLVEPVSIYAGTVVIAVFLFLVNRNIFLHGLLAALVSFAIFFITHKIVGRKLGMGDVKYSLLCGIAAAQILWAIAGLLAGCVITALTFEICYLAEKKDKVKTLPFVPFLFAGMIIVLVVKMILGY